MTHMRQLRSLISGLSMGAATVALAIAIVFALSVSATQSAEAQTLTVLHAFTGGQDGANPLAGLTMDKAGNLDGTASQGGGSGNGVVFRLTHKGSGWVFSPLYSFQGGNDGAAPGARVIIGPDGSLYGTTQNGGGTNPGGTVFKLTPYPTACKTALCGWQETQLYAFKGGSDGALPGPGDLVFDQAGNLYGTTKEGGASLCGFLCGTVYKLMPSNDGWTKSILYNFMAGSDGEMPSAGVIFDQAGNLHGTTYEGGVGKFGTVFQLTCGVGGCTNNVLHSFTNGGDGGSPVGGLILDQSGNLYGAGSDGGTGGDGTVFELSPSGDSWTFAVLYNFTSPLGGQCGPRAGLVMDAAGNLYGTTFCDGAYGYGNVFELSPSNGGWTYWDLYDFTGGNDGKNPISNVLLHSNGKLYGTTSVGGTQGFGVVWELTP
jgi:uncharacterized repeat protein (TIGR03803 family)